MVKSKFFETGVPLFRALKDFLVQFGLAGHSSCQLLYCAPTDVWHVGDPDVQKIFHEKGNLKDDPSWLPLGPSGRIIDGVSRFQK
jgi:hypothetical protein